MINGVFKIFSSPEWPATHHARRPWTADSGALLTSRGRQPDGPSLGAPFLPALAASPYPNGSFLRFRTLEKRSAAARIFPRYCEPCRS